MRGAPQVGFSATLRRIRARTSLLTRFRPPTRRTLESNLPYKPNPARCPFTTVLGVTKMRGFLHPDQKVFNATQNSLCRAVNRRRGRCAHSQQLPTQSQVLEDEVLAGTESADHPPEEMPERHDHGRILSERSSTTRALRQVIHFVGVRRFGEAQVPCRVRRRAARKWE
jgi:hypothetical protein